MCFPGCDHELISRIAEDINGHIWNIMEQSAAGLRGNGLKKVPALPWNLQIDCGIWFLKERPRKSKEVFQFGPEYIYIRLVSTGISHVDSFVLSPHRQPGAGGGSVPGCLFSRDPSLWRIAPSPLPWRLVDLDPVQPGAKWAQEIKESPHTGFFGLGIGIVRLTCIWVSIIFAEINR